MFTPRDWIRIVVLVVVCSAALIAATLLIATGTMTDIPLGIP